MERDSFIFYKSFYDAVSEADTGTQLMVYNAIFRKALYDEDVFLEGTAKMLFTLIKPQLEANSKRYLDGKKGGRPKEKTTGYKEIKTTGFENKKPNNNVNENVNVNENNNNNNNASDSCVDGLQKVIEFYNNNIGMITPYGLEILQSYISEMPVELIILAMKKAVEADKRTIQYIKGILNNWSKKGIKTVIEAQKEDEQFRNKGTIQGETEEEKKARKIKELEESIKNGNI